MALGRREAAGPSRGGEGAALLRGLGGTRRVAPLAWSAADGTMGGPPAGLLGRAGWRGHQGHRGLRPGLFQCWENFVGQELYRLMVLDFIFILLDTLFGELVWR